MTTAQRQVTTSTVSYTGSTSTAISSLRSKIDAGEVCTADDINTLATMIGSWDNHTHTYEDLYHKATYGAGYGDNPKLTGDRVEGKRNITTGQHDEAGTNPSTVTKGSLITAAYHNTMRDVVNKLRSHKHTISDQTTK